MDRSSPPATGLADGRRVAVTGARTFLGRSLLGRLDADPRYHTVLALDVGNPALDTDRVHFEVLDLTSPDAGRGLADVLAEYRIDTLVHGAYLSFPTHALTWAHELEDVGTMHVLDASAAAGVQRLVQISTTLVYGARPEHPNYVSESTRLVSEGSGFVGDKVRADLQTGRFAEANPEIAVCQLRFAPLLGPTVDGLFPRFFSPPVAPVMMGHDPLIQLLHETDALHALKLVVDRQPAPRGAFNIAGRGVLPYSTMLALMGKIRVPLPHPLARSLAKLAWTSQIARTPPVLLDYLRYLCVADTRRAETELGFRAEYNQKQIALDYLGVTGEDALVDLARVGAT